MSQVSIFAKGSVLDFYGQPSNPANPPANQARMFYNSTTDQMVVIDSTGADILAVGPYSIALAANAAITWGGDTGLSRDSAGVLDVGTGAQGSAAGSLKATNITITGAMAMSSGQVISWNGDTAISRDSGGVFDFGTGAQGSKAGTINATTANITGTSTLATLKATKAVSTGINAIGNVSGSGVSIDLSLGNVITMTLTGNVTSSSFANAVASAGEEVTFIITQNGTGGYTFAWPTAVIPAGINPFPSLGANTVSIFKGVVDGSGNVNWINNGGTVVFRGIYTGIVTSDTTDYITLYEPTVIGEYMLYATVWCTTTGTTATMAIRPCILNNNITWAADAATGSSGVAVATTLGGQHSTAAPVKVFSTSGSSNAMGFHTVLTNAIGAAVFAAEFIVIFLGQS